MVPKVFILGCPGSGKSTLARYMGGILNSKSRAAKRFTDYGKPTASNLLEKKVHSRDAQNQKYEPNNDDKVRRFLAIWTAFLMLGALVGYLITRDAGVLVGTTVNGIAVTFVFGYYFKRRED